MMQQAACMAGAWAATGPLPALPALAADPTPVPAGAATGPWPRSLLVDTTGRPLPLRALRPGEPWLINWPYQASPVFVLALGTEVQATDHASRQQPRYAAPAGVGPQRRVVAYSAICPHKLMYPRPAISFIGVRAGGAGEPAHVIHCCGDGSRYDPAQGARVLAGPAPQPLAAVVLEWNERDDSLHAVGLRGGAVFAAFFDKYAFQLDLALGPRARALAGPQVLAQPAAAYSRQWQSCKA
jgi:Rieske Fe-S protein